MNKARKMLVIWFHRLIRGTFLLKSNLKGDFIHMLSSTDLYRHQRCLQLLVLTTFFWNMKFNLWIFGWIGTQLCFLLDWLSTKNRLPDSDNKDKAKRCLLYNGFEFHFTPFQISSTKTPHPRNFRSSFLKKIWLLRPNFELFDFFVPTWLWSYVIGTFHFRQL